MVPALERARLAPLGRAQLSAAVPADVQEGAEGAVLAADHEDALLADAHRPIVTRGGELIPAPDGDPEAGEQALLLELPDRGIVVEAPGQGARQAAAGLRRGVHGASAAGNTMTFRSASPPSIATIASLIRSSG